jgi:hypothetical protein
MQWNRLLKLIQYRKTAIWQPLKTQGAAMGIGLLSILVAYGIEPCIPQEVLDILVLVTLMTLGVTLWIQLRNACISIICNALAVSFHFYCDSCFVRQAALTFIIVGSVITFWQGISHRKSKNTPKPKI